LVLIIGVSIIYTTPYAKAAEDNYEENDIYLEAYDIDSNAGQWLSEIDGLGYQNDHDWYSFDLTFGRLIVYYSGSVNIQISKQSDPFNYLYNQNDFTNKILDVNVDTGIVWLIKISGSNEGNSYNIYWDDITWTWNDHYENNDDYSTAYDLTSYENTYLSGIDSLGVSDDHDWFKFTADPYNLHVQIDFKTNIGDYFELYLFDTDGSTWLDEESWSNNMQIDYYLPCPGTYFIRVTGDYSHYIYDLRWNELPYLWDDNYEPNDAKSNAYFLSYTRLSDDQGLGKQSDDDWYDIVIGRPNLILDIDCTFTHADGNIDISLYDYSGTLVASSTSTTNNEHIDYELDHLHILHYYNHYFIKVYGDDNMNDYDLQWSASPPSDDIYEQNDDFNEVYDFSAHENTWLSTIGGEAINLDQDWYRIHVDPGGRAIEINCTFTYNYGDIELALYDDSETLIKESKSDTDDEFIKCVLPTGGSYYIKVFQDPFYTFFPNHYDLKWNTYIPIEDNYEENDDLGSSYDISLNESIWLDQVNGIGRQNDLDWYKIYIPSGEHNLEIECSFTHSLGDIDIALYDASEIKRAEKKTITDNETINTFLTGNAYYHVLVYGKTCNSGNEYNLRWNMTFIPPSDDNYEENDNIGDAYSLSAYNSTWLHDIDGHGRQIDDDWYEISIITGVPILEIECTFTHADGNIDIGLYYANGTQIAVSISTDNNEFITQFVSISGFYYVNVFGPNWGNEYDLKWTTGLDNTPPLIINAPDDISLFTDYTDVEISWIATDEDPNIYTIELAGIGIVDGPTSWSSGVAVTYDIPEGLLVGDHFYTINFTDESGNFITDEVKITVQGDVIDPIVTFGTEDYSLANGYTEEFISWIATDENPNTYTIEVQGCGVIAGPIVWYSGVEIHYYLPEELTPGDYFYTVNFTDDAGNFATDTVKLTIQEETTGDAPAIPFGNHFLVFMTISIIALILLQKRKR